MQIDKKTIRNLVIGALVCVFAYWLLHETDRMKLLLGFVINMLSPFFIGAGIAFILNVPMRAIEGKMGFVKIKGLRRAIALILTLIFVVLLLSAVLWILLPQLMDTIQSLVAKLPGFIQRVAEIVTDFLNDHPEVVEWLKENTSFESFNWEAITEKAINFVGNGLKIVMERAFSYIGSFSIGVFNAVVSFVFSIYCLSRKERLSRQGRKLLYAFIPEKAGDEVVRIMRLTNATFSNFISGQCIEAVILGLMFVVAMLIFRMPYVALISVTIAVTALIPIVGAFAGCIVGAFFILIDDPVKAVWFVIMFLVLQQIEGNLIYPKVVGKSVGLPGMWVLVAVSVGGELMGVAGMFIMIPLMAVVYTLLGEITTKLVVKKGIDQDKLSDHAPDLGVQAHHRLFKFKKRKKKQAEIVEAVDNQEEQ